MASSKDRQRALARAKAERQSARRAAAAKRRRQVQAAVTGGVALAVVVLASLWAGGVFDSPPPKPDDCLWSANADSTNTDLKDVGTPPTRNIPKSGTRTMTITTNQGVVEAALDLKHSACAGASFSYLASKKFFDNTKCHKLLTFGTYALQCGDPAGNDKGGPSYTFTSENLPVPDPEPSASASAAPSGSASADASAAPSASTSPAPSASAAPKTTKYLRGMLALYNNGGANGSQFYIIYKDSPDLPPQYSIFGWVTKGLDVVDKIAAGGVQQIGGQEAIGGAPKLEVTISSLTVGKRQPGDLPATPSPYGLSPSAPPASTSAAPSGSATP